MGDKIKLLTKSLGEERVKLKENLKYHTFLGSKELVHFKADHEAEVFYIATTQKELIEILDLCLQLEIPFLVFGSGTKLILSNKKIAGLSIKNRTAVIKIGGIKGKVGKGGLGIEEALLEVDSGVSLGKLNEFLNEQRLAEISGFSSLHATVGGAVFIDPQLQNACQKIRIWDRGDVIEINPFELKRNYIVLSAILKVKS